MRLHVKDSLALISEQLQAEAQIRAMTEKAIAPIAEKRDAAVQAALNKDYAIQDFILNAARLYSQDLKKALFGIAERAEYLMRKPFERRDVRFESDALDFFKSSQAESVNRFSQWLSFSLTKDFNYKERRAVEFRRRGSYAGAESSYYSRRPSGESRRKLIDDKAEAIAYETDRQFSGSIEDALKQAIGEYLDNVDSFVKPQTSTIRFAIARRTEREILKMKTRVILMTAEREAVDLYTEAL